MKKLLKKIWQGLSFVFVLYGFYLLFLFLMDTFTRLNESIALPLSLLVTFITMAISGLFWLRKHKKHLPIRL